MGAAGGSAELCDRGTITASAALCCGYRQPETRQAPESAALSWRCAPFTRDSEDEHASLHPLPGTVWDGADDRSTVQHGVWILQMTAARGAWNVHREQKPLYTASQATCMVSGGLVYRRIHVVGKPAARHPEVAAHKVSCRSTDLPRELRSVIGYGGNQRVTNSAGQRRARNA